MAFSVIQVRGLETQIGGKPLHHHLNLDVEQGEILGVVGGSGSGKSVLLRTLLGLHPFQKGRIRILGHPIPQGLKELRAKWGVQFQGGALFTSLTAGENIQFPLRELFNIPLDVAQFLSLLKLKLVGLREEDAFKYPAQLSGGMVKRVALARSLALDPPLLFLDEPTAGLDPLGAAAYDELLLHLRSALQLTVMMITHDLNSLKSLADRIAVLLDGRLIIGTLEELLYYDHPWIRAYFSGSRGNVVRG